MDFQNLMEIKFPWGHRQTKYIYIAIYKHFSKYVQMTGRGNLIAKQKAIVYNTGVCGWL